MLKRERYIEDIKEQMAIFQYKIELETSLNHHNLKLYGENFFRDILNIVYPKADFTNTNFLKSNYSAIDLICHKTEKCIQITSNRTRDKIKDTINAYKKSQYYDYDIEIYYLLEKAKPNNIKDLEKELNIEDLSSKLKDSRDLMKSIDNLEVEELERVWRLFKINDESIHFLPKLKEKYLNDFSTISLLINDIPKPIEDIFINLAIIKEQKENKQDKNLMSREALLNSYEEIHKPKEPIEIEELINISNKSLIYGKAGIGKTTFCKFIAYKWAKGELYSEFEYIIYLPLREWKRGGILQAIKNYYFPLDSDELSFELKGANRLFLFDGYDELSGERKKDLRDEIEKYGLSHYIITTRPYGYQRNDFRVDEHFQTIGFVDEDVEAYIDNFFEESEPKKRLKAFLNSNIGIKHIAYIPLMLEMICSLWQEQPFSDSLTMTELYSAVVESILKKHSAKKEDKAVYKRANRKKINNILGKLAFRGLTKQTILFDGDFIEEVIDDEDIEFFEKSVINSGFLKSDRQEKDMLDNNFEFLHLTFQEYFSALYVASLSKEEQSEIIRDWKFYTNNKIFFSFLAGVIENKEFLLKEIDNSPIDLVGFYQFGLIVDCIYQIKKNKLSKKYIKNFNKKLEYWINITIQESSNYELILDSFFMILHIVEDKLIDKIFQISLNSKNEYLQEYIINIFCCLGTTNQKYKNFLTKFEKKIPYIEKIKVNKKEALKNQQLIDEILDELDGIFSCNCFMIRVLRSIDNNIYINQKLKLEINRIFNKYGITNISKWYSENENYILNSDFSTIIIESEKEYFIQNTKNEFIEESLRKEYQEIVSILDVNDDCMIRELINIIKNKNYNWILRGEVVLLLQEILKKDKKQLSHAMLELWIDNELHEDIRINAIESIYLDNYNNDFIDELISPYINEKNIFSYEMLDVLAIKLAEISKNNFYAYILELNILDNDLTDIDIHFLIKYYEVVNIAILFKAYDEGYSISYALFINCIENNLPLYLKNNKLCTIYYNKEIKTIEDVDNEFLEELNSLMEGDNLND